MEHNPPRSLELCCGSATISSALSAQGFDTKSLDHRKRAGVCTPDFHLDLMKVKNSPALFGKIDLVWFSPPCQCWSNAPGSYHFFEGVPQQESTKYLVKVLEKGLEIIEELNPRTFIIENPRGKLRYYKKMTDFLIRNNGMIKQVMYSDYGFPTQKPTNLFTNFHSLQVSSNAKYGRGHKAPAGNLNNMTVVQRQEIPRTLAQSIAEQSAQLFGLTTSNHSILDEIKVEHEPTSPMETAQD